MATARKDADLMSCFGWAIIGALGATVYFMWADIQALWK
jgi:hypothetical protein